MKKRILLTVTKETYERLQKNVRAAGLPKNWFSSEIDKVITGLDIVVQQMIEAKQKGEQMTEQQVMETILRTSESVQKMKIRKIEIEDSE